MPDFDNYSGLFSYIDTQVNKAIVEISEVFYDVLRNLVMTKFYDVYEPDLYKRTYEVYDSISIDVYSGAKGYNVNVYFDTDKIHPRRSTFWIPPNMPRYDHHMSMHGEIMSDKIVNILNDGYTFGENRQRKAGRFLEEMQKYIRNKNNWLPEFTRFLKKKGLEVTVSVQ